MSLSRSSARTGCQYPHCLTRHARSLQTRIQAGQGFRVALRLWLTVRQKRTTASPSCLIPDRSVSKKHYTFLTTNCLSIINPKPMSLHLHPTYKDILSDLSYVFMNKRTFKFLTCTHMTTNSAHFRNLPCYNAVNHIFMKNMEWSSKYF